MTVFLNPAVRNGFALEFLHLFSVVSISFFHNPIAVCLVLFLLMYYVIFNQISLGMIV